MKKRTTTRAIIRHTPLAAILAAACFLAAVPLPALGGGALSCPGVDLVETNLENGKSSGYYIPGLKLIILNRTILQSYAEPVRQFILAHECAHADPEVGEDEMAADCAASARGTKEGWLGAQDLIKVCVHLSRFPADATHPPIQPRCANIRRCASGGKFEIAQKPSLSPEKDIARTPLMTRQFE